jgi:hypothetical protein
MVVTTVKTEFTLLVTNTDTDIKMQDGKIAITFAKQRAYVLIKLK